MQLFPVFFFAAPSEDQQSSLTSMRAFLRAHAELMDVSELRNERERLAARGCGRVTAPTMALVLFDVVSVATAGRGRRPNDWRRFVTETP